MKYRLLVTLALVFSAITTTLTLSPAAAAINVFENSCQGAADSAVCKSQNDNATDFMQIIIDTMMILLGGIAVIMIVIAGIKYTTSNGDPSKTKSAKDTMLYSVIGIVVAISAYAIVKFITNRF